MGVAIPVLETRRLILEPLLADHADELFPVLADARLSEYTGSQRPPSVEALRDHYRVLATGESPDGSELWWNWAVRVAETDQMIGFVQASVRDDQHTAELGWEIGTASQRRGYGTEAVTAMTKWIRGHGISEIVAHVHPKHIASIKVAEAAGLVVTDRLIDGEAEYRWERTD